MHSTARQRLQRSSLRALISRRSLLAITLSGMLLAACSGSGGGSATSASLGTTSTCPERGGTMIVGLEDEPSTLFGLAPNGDSATARVEPMLQSFLVSIGRKFQPEPQLAQSWAISNRGLTYTFHLNPKAMWTDGTPVTAADVAYTFHLLAGPIGANPNGQMTRIASATATGPHTFVVKLKAPWLGFLLSLGNENDFWPIYPEHVLEAEHLSAANITKIAYNTAPTVTSGPFEFKRWVRGQYVELVRNPHYYLPGLPCLSRIVASFLPNPATRGSAFADGNVDFLDSYMVPFQELHGLESNSRTSAIQGGLGVGPIDYLEFNVRNNRYLAVKAVRQAIAYAIDRSRYVEEVNFGWGKVAHSPISSTLTDFYTSAFDHYSYDPAKANVLLDQAGFRRGPNGTRFSLNLVVRSDRPYEVTGADVIKSALSTLGINVSIQEQDSATFYTTVYTQHAFDLGLQLHTSGPDPAENLPTMFGPAGITPGGNNGGRFDDPKLDKLFAQDSVATTQSQRVVIWRQAQAILMDDLPWLPLFEFPDYQLVASNCHRVIVGALDYEGQFSRAYCQG